MDGRCNCSWVTKGLMLPPGIAFNFVSKKAIEISTKNNYRRSYWDWEKW